MAGNLQSAIESRAVLLSSIGKAALNARFPDEFELYVLALELIDGKGKTLKYFIFPVMPSNLDETQPVITSIKKTQAGVSAISNTTFAPRDIVITGNFGRQFKMLLGSDFVSASSALTTGGSIVAGAATVFDPRVKTGYGCLKILEDIVDQSKVVDKNGPRRLILYNPVFGNNYVVKPTQFKISQSQESNMFHNYTLQLKAIAPLSSIQSDKDNTNLAIQLNTAAYLQKSLNNAINQLTTLLTTI